jgi:hypothetical protein
MDQREILSSIGDFGDIFFAGIFVLLKLYLEAFPRTGTLSK